MNSTAQPVSSLAIVLLLGIVLVPAVHILVALYGPGGPEGFAQAIGREAAALQVEETDVSKILQAAMDRTYDVLYRDTGLSAALAREASPWREALAKAYPVLAAVILTAELLALRLTILAISTPYALLLVGLACTDGWVGWRLRRQSGARESAFLYHRAKRIFLELPLIAGFLYCVLPPPVHPALILPATMVAAAIAARFSVTYFKKHL